MEKLTDRQREALEFVARMIEERGYPPSVRELCEEMGISSTRGALRHLEALERKGYISRASGARALRLEERERYSKAYLPILGEVPAGPLSYAFEEAEEWISVPANWGKEGRFLLRVRGDSMIGDHIQDGDLVVVDPRLSGKQGEIVVALVGDEATVKRLYRKGKEVELRASNPAYPPISLKEGGEEVRVLGRVIALLREKVI